MPSRNTVKQFAAPAYYHVYNRGAGGQKIFQHPVDKQKFLAILARHLDPDDTSVRADGVPYTKYDVELNAYCLMGNHFHLLLFQESDTEAVTKLLRSVCTAYTMYFNKRYKRQGHLFQSIFKASHIANEPYALHISRYIHLNPRTYRTYAWSSLGPYLGEREVKWVHPARFLDMSPAQYLEFIEDYTDRKEVLEGVKKQLAL